MTSVHSYPIQFLIFAVLSLLSNAIDDSTDGTLTIPLQKKMGKSYNKFKLDLKDDIFKDFNGNSHQCKIFSDLI